MNTSNISLNNKFGDKDVIVIGSGPSVADYDIDALQCKIKTIAVNSSVGYWPWADVCVMLDKYDDTMKANMRLESYKGIVITKASSQ